MKYIYKITYPNGKIYIGQDRVGEITYFGSVDPDLVRKDFTEDDMRDFTVRKQILWQLDDATVEEINEKEMELIMKYQSNNPNVGYNQRPKYRRKNNQ